MVQVTFIHLAPTPHLAGTLFISVILSQMEVSRSYPI